MIKLGQKGFNRLLMVDFFMVFITFSEFAIVNIGIYQQFLIELVVCNTVKS